MKSDEERTSNHALTLMDEDYRQLATLSDERRYPELIALAQGFLSKYPRHIKGLKLLGFANLVVGDIEAALTALTEAILIDATDPELFDHVGCVYNMIGRYKEAGESFDKSLALDDGRAETWGNQGKNLSDQGDNEGAVSSYRRALSINPALADIQSNLGASLCEIGCPQDALEHLDQAVALDSGNVWVFIHRGNAFKDLARFDDAIQDYDYALTIDQKLYQGWLSLSDVLQKSGDTTQALSAAERAFSLQPNNPEVLNALGTMYAIAK